MTLEDRQVQILDAVTPAVLEHGAAITSRQLADAAGVAEGTLFRSFGDKDSLLRAVFDRAAEVAYDLDELDGLADETLATTVRAIAGVLTVRLSSIFRMAIALGPVLLTGDRTDDPRFDELRDRIAELLAEHADELGVAPLVAADALRTLTFAAATGWGDRTAMDMSDVTGILLHGIARTDRKESRP
jgi:AcrR family transcriptional regulator